jgi:LPS export ABC transporter protein LptC
MKLLLYSFFKKAAALCAGCFFLYACENDIKDVEALTGKKTSVEEGTNIVSYLSQEAIVKAKLEAPVMKRFQTDSPYVEFPKSLFVSFYNDSMQIENTLRANYGTYRENEHKVFLKDSIVVVNLKGDTLWCRELWWDQHKEQFYTDKPVRVRQPDKILYGKGLTAAQNFSTYTIKVVTGIVQVPKEGLFDSPPDSLQQVQADTARVQ